MLSWPAFLLISLNLVEQVVRNSATTCSKVSRGCRKSYLSACFENLKFNSWMLWDNKWIQIHIYAQILGYIHKHIYTIIWLLKYTYECNVLYENMFKINYSINVCHCLTFCQETRLPRSWTEYQILQCIKATKSIKYTFSCQVWKRKNLFTSESSMSLS